MAFSGSLFLVRTKPMTGPRSPTGGPCCAGVAVSVRISSPGAGSSSSCQGLQANCVSLKALRTCGSGDDSGRPGKKLAAGAIEIIQVMIVTQQDCIDGSDGRSIDGWAGDLGKRYRAGGVGAARRIESWVGEKAKPRDVDQESGTADIGQPKIAESGHRQLLETLD